MPMCPKGGPPKRWLSEEDANPAGDYGAGNGHCPAGYRVNFCATPMP
jgi:hypothetical protein